MRQLPWTHHQIILSLAKPVETREFYLLAAIKERWPKWELDRHIFPAQQGIYNRWSSGVGDQVPLISHGGNDGTLARRW